MELREYNAWLSILMLDRPTRSIFSSFRQFSGQIPTLREKLCRTVQELAVFVDSSQSYDMFAKIHFFVKSKKAKNWKKDKKGLINKTTGRRASPSAHPLFLPAFFRPFSILAFLFWTKSVAKLDCGEGLGSLALARAAAEVGDMISQWMR